LSNKYFTLLVLLVLLIGASNKLAAQNSQSLIDPKTFRGPAEDQRAYRVGDILTVYVQEVTRARSQATTDSSRRSGIGLELQTSSISEAGQAGVRSQSTGGAETGRIGELRAQIVVQVLEIDANGLMRVQGNQSLVVNNEAQRFTLSGLIRPQDVSSNNTVWSNRIANAQVELNGKGIVSDAQRKSILNRIFKWLGL
jgi:flagellar L-ring protein FlgH